MSARRGSLALLSFVMLIACGREPVPTTGFSSAPSGSRLLPAYSLPGERRVPGKADAAGDYRAAHPAWYEPTVAPAPGFRAMREWEPMSTLLIAYSTSLVGDASVGQTVVDTIKAARSQGTVVVLVDGAAARDEVTARLQAAGVPASEIGEGKAVRFEQLPLDAFWTIDFGPLPLVGAGGTLAFLDWQYYWGRYLDDAVPSELGQRWDTTVYRMPASYEGGNFQADGLGTCYTTERGLQNAGVAEAELRAQFEAYAGCQQLVVLKDIWNDGTGHVDMFFKLITPARAILGSFADAQDSRARTDMNDNETLLKGLTLPAGTAMTVLRMPHPNAWVDAGGTVPRTYLNSTLFNGLNLWPVYTVDQDLQADAQAVWQQAMPGWTHLGILSDEISKLSGAIHCITRTLPDFPAGPWVADGVCDAGTGLCAAGEGGYTGACTSDADCVGPQWLCVPAGTCGTVVDTCDGLTYEGCCDGGTVRWCENGAVQQVDCATSFPLTPLCGWSDGAAYYWCGATEQADPGGAFPRTCPGACVPDCAGKACDADDGCGNACGCAVGFLCQAGACVACTPDCTGKACGDDGCGGSCGACGPDEGCQAGTCVNLCGGLTYEGCCDGAKVSWCDASGAHTVDCATESPTAPKCTWDAGSAFYWCGPDRVEEPTGTFPWACPGGCVPDCGGKACDADDGCGQPCGCGAGFTCVGGVCTAACVPDCTGKACGDDGCGGTCGTCTTGWSCVDGACVDPCQGLTYEGCCDHDVVRWCENGQVYEVACASSSAGAVCGWSAAMGYYWCGAAATPDPSGAWPPVCDGCVADCAGRTCGADGCFGSCGACPEGSICRDGSCEACTPDCAGKACGDDGCLGTCGACADGLVCQAGQCVDPCGGVTYEGCCDGSVVRWCGGSGVVEIDCATWTSGAQRCGWDATLGYYWCGDTYDADPSGTFPWACAGGCVPDCAGKACDADDGCGDPCGCDAGLVCGGGACQVCVPDCAGKACGADGCGGSCGTCGLDEGCTGGQCVNLCDGLTYEGCCEGTTVRWCDANGAQEVDCATAGFSSGTSCGWLESAGYYWCEASESADPTGVNPRECPVPCEPSCAGKECGDDGCGGSCGACAEHHACAAGACVYVPWCGDATCDAGETCATCPADCACGCGQACAAGVCTFTACTGKACGDDGCGGSCGACAPGSSCQAGACVPDPTCGNGTCSGGETCATCPFDCGCGCGEGCVAGTCVRTACEGRQCGSDGCGGSCGTCGLHHVCEEGVCTYVPWCGDGVCDPAEDCADCPADCGCGCGEACATGVCEFTACVGRLCGDDGCGGTCGACPEHYACDDGACAYVAWCGDGVCNGDETCSTCAADCTCGCGHACDHGVCAYTACEGRQCGSDGCGGSCGTCPDHHACQKGACTYVPWCGDGACDPGEDCATCPSDCGCGCGQDCVASVPGLRSLGEAGCVFTACDGRECGDDGCGGSCGKCGEHHACQKGVCVVVPWCGDGNCDAGEDCAACANDCGCGCGQACVASVPGPRSLGEAGCVFTACDGRACGDDGCGGSCGTCAEHHACVDGACDYVPWCGDGACDVGETCATCEADCGCGCGQACQGGICTFVACEDRACGDDGCGGSCGTCTGAQDACVDHQCVCQPACTGLECGDDGCGGACGSCAEHRECQAGTCVVVPWCGDAACNGSETCGSCPADCGCGCGQACGGDVCAYVACEGRACGDDGCGGSCGACGDHEACVDGACVVQPFCGDGTCNGDERCDTCEADCDCVCGYACRPEQAAGDDLGQVGCVYAGCEARECGDDGCNPPGPSCGACGDHEACLDGLCVATPWCGDGTCDLDEDCASCPGDCACGCGETCVEGACAATACDGRECGSDGCGGSCGECTGCGQACVDGLCASVACEGRACGDDGCGGSCGACGEHEVCTDGQCVGQPWCGDGTCGAGEDCDQCPADCGCDDDHLCREGVCRPIGCEWVDDWCDYVGWQCGDDGCGTSCGECAKGETCVDNVCEAIEGDVVQPDQLTPDAEGDTSVADEERATGGGSSCAASNQGAPMASGTALVAFALGLVLLLRRKPLSR